MKERPIPFKYEMVRAVLDGHKTQTRRVINPQPIGDRVSWGCKGGHGFGFFFNSGDDFRKSKFGEPGDRLWVRERIRVIDIADHGSKVAAIRVKYEADGDESDFIEYPDRLEGTPIIGKCLAYGGFREASRILLEITGVRVERVQDISEEDAEAEGCDRAEGIVPASWAVDAFHVLWDSINAKRGFGWDVNPWVWVVEFRKITA